jgi:hypothetical protein
LRKKLQQKQINEELLLKVVLAEYRSFIASSCWGDKIVDVEAAALGKLSIPAADAVSSCLIEHSGVERNISMSCCKVVE